MEILFSLLYAIFIGLYNVNKKVSLKKSNETTILALFTTCSLILALLWIPFGIGVPAKFVGVFAFKGFIISVSWFITLKVLKNVDLSIVTVTQILSTVLIFVSGLVIFKETAGVLQIIGSILIVASAASLNIEDKIILVQASLVFSGIATLIQLFPLFNKIGSRLPLIMGSSFAYVPVLTVLAGEFNVATIFGAQVVGGIVAIIFGIFSKNLSESSTVISSTSAIDLS
jgi:uncharacterized membrane protein